MPRVRALRGESRRQLVQQFVEGGGLFLPFKGLYIRALSLAGIGVFRSGGRAHARNVNIEYFS